uniref:Uncharacterized protein n=1 Tax=Romanomermis culicivorax TaxID=13658 RepID=A0A915JA23_ROMCU
MFRPWHERYFSHCGWDLNNMRCSKTAQACRYAVINIRGTPLEADCYCPRQDATCSNLQSAIYFRNPCFEEARLTMIAKFTTKKPTTPSTTTTTMLTTTTTTKAKTTPTTTSSSLAATRIAVVPPFDTDRTVPRRTRPLTHLITITQAPVVRTVPHSTILPTSTTSDRFPMPFPTTARTTKSTTTETTSKTTTSRTSITTTTSNATKTTTSISTSTTTAITTTPP